MKTSKYIICFLLSLALILNNISYVYASSGSFDGFSLDGTYTDDNGREFQAYTYNNGDDTALPSGFKYYYKYPDGKVITMERSEVIANILNKKIGVVMEPLRLSEFIADYGSGIVGRNPEYYNNLRPVLKNGILVGVALNSLTGGIVDSNNNNSPVAIPSTEVNNVYNYYQYWNSLPEHKEYPEYITIHGCTSAQMESYCSSNNQINSVRAAIMPFFTNSYLTKSTMKCSFNEIHIQDDDTFLCLDGFNTFCNDLDLSMEKREISWSEMLSGSWDSTNIRQYSNQDFSAVNVWKYVFVSSNPTLDTQTASYYTFRGGSTASCQVVCGDLTIWKNTTVINSIKNNTYNSPSYTTNNYQNFNTGNDNQYTVTPQQVSNSTTDNTNIYNESNTSNNTNISNQIDNSDNSYTSIDNSSVVTNTTTIVNTYYNTYYPDSGNNDDPSGGDDSSGGGGSDLEDDSILDSLLAAILKLLRAIGKIIATILTGIIEIITDVLAAIANITTAFTGIIDFIASIFGFLPSECIAVLTLGLTLSVLIALLKMFGK